MNSTTPTPATSQGGNQPPKNVKKRKSPSQLALLRKRIRQYLITCPVAISILRDLGLRNRSTLNSGKFLAWTVDPTDPIFQTIHEYVSNGQGGRRLPPWQPHRCSTKILGILRISPGGTQPNFDDNPLNKGQQRMMLWHGCKAMDARHALQRGLKLNKEHKHQLWGAGYYFGDMISEALIFSFDQRYVRDGEDVKDVYRIGNVIYLFLCEVLIGNDVYQTYTKEPGAPEVTPKQSLWDIMTKQPPPAKVTVDSIKVTGVYGPEAKGNREIDGCVWPMGKRTAQIGWSTLIYNRNWGAFFGNLYAVYDHSRVIPRYLVKVEIIEGMVKEKIC